MFFLPWPALAAASPKPKRAALQISGYGILGNRELKRILNTLELGGQKPEFFTASFVEDAAIILSARIKRDGYLQPEITVGLRLADGGHLEATADELLEAPLDRSARFIKVHFTIHKGRLYHYEKVEFEGLEAISTKEARGFFIESGFLIPLKRTRIYTPERIRQGLASITDILDRKGYETARAEVTKLIRDDNNGSVIAHLTVNQGPKFVVRSVREEFFYDQETGPSRTNDIFPGRAHSKIWIQDFTQSLKTNEFHQGYPDTRVELQTLRRESNSAGVQLDLQAKVRSGARVQIGAVDFEGQKKTRPSLLSRRVRVKRGEVLDRIKVEEGSTRLAQLGPFDKIDLTYRPVDEHTRDVLYSVHEGKTIDLNLLFGYGSYELLRGGFEIEQFNIWGLAHHAQLKVIQSFKASSADFNYTVPEFVGRDVDLFLHANGLRREEVSFTREEYGGGFGAHKDFKGLATDVTLRYNYEILNAAQVNGIVATEGVTNAQVGAIIADIKHDRRDNPLYPRRGYKVFATLEVASEYLAGDVNFERFDLAAAWHQPLGGGRYLGLGLSHGVVLTSGNPAQDLPFNRRFFPGGENSLRGYTEGEASPRNEQGKIVGAETFTLGTVEFEQSLTPHWSVVFFSDSLGFARRAANYPFDTSLFSVGGGLRWKTIIGPIRVEYGHNLNPRPKDPAGALHFSLGFPF